MPILLIFFEVSINAIANWKAQHPGFLGALKGGKLAADSRVGRSLYHRALGYTFDAVKILKNKGEAVVRVPYRDHVPPDTTACIFWLKNRRPALWRDKQAMEHTGKDGGPMEIIRRALKDIEHDGLEPPCVVEERERQAAKDAQAASAPAGKVTGSE